MRLPSIIFLFCALCVSALTAGAQIRIVPREKIEAVASPRLSSDSSSLMFNTRHIVAAVMSEDDPPAIYRYEMTNVGTETVNVLRINTTCSCVTVNASRTSIAPGEMSTLTVRYDPKGHPGRFERKIFIYTQPGNNPAAILELTAHVERSMDKSKLYHVQMGNIRLRSEEIRFTKGTKAIEALNFINLSGGPLKLECDEATLPKCLAFETVPSIVEDGGEGVLKLAYDPAEGECGDNVSLILKGLGVSPEKSAINIRFE